MYGQLEVLRMIEELRREEQLAASQLYILLQPAATQPMPTPARPRLLQWLGHRLVALGYRLLAAQPPQPVNPCV